jgi:methenyltetrahydromethanopterin cyclohydrolase
LQHKHKQFMSQSLGDKIAEAEANKASELAPAKSTKKRFNKAGEEIDYRPKLNFVIAERIRERVANGEVKNHLAKEYGVDFETISMIVKGLTYKK